MAALDKDSFETKYNDPAIGLFKTNTTQNRTTSQDRQLVTDVKDSYYNLSSHAFTGARGTIPGVYSIADLKAIVTTSITVGATVTVRDTGAADVLRIYQLVTGTTAESSPDFIRPDDYAGTTNEKIWRLIKIIPRYSRPGISTIADLKAILTASVSGLETGTYISFADSGASDVLRTYKLTAGTTAESSPDVIRPNDYAGTTNEKVWLLVHHSINGGTP
jgi:hypothetical protein